MKPLGLFYPSEIGFAIEDELEAKGIKTDCVWSPIGVGIRVEESRLEEAKKVRNEIVERRTN